MKTPFSSGEINRGMRNGMATRVIGPWDWIIVPALIALAATIVLSVPFQPFGFDLPEPVIPLMLAFTWPLIRPSYIAPLVLGGLGLFLDFHWGQAIGFWTLNLMLVYGALILLRTWIIGQEWIVVFACYLATELLFFGIGTVFIIMDTGAIPRLWGVLEQAFATTLLFPFVLYLLEKYVHSDVRFQ